MGVLLMAGLSRRAGSGFFLCRFFFFGGVMENPLYVETSLKDINY